MKTQGYWIIAGVVVLVVVIGWSILWSGGGVNKSVRTSAVIWVKCTNLDCAWENLIERVEYLQYVRRYQVDSQLPVPPMRCKDCEQESVYPAKKCGHCGLVFVRGIIGDDFVEKCPECGRDELY